MKSVTRLIVEGKRLRCATKRVNDSPKAETATTVNIPIQCGIQNDA
jgi:hypothetical protein